MVHLAVPENRVYPNWIPSFHEAVLEWAKDSQKELLSHPLEDFSSFSLEGGHYTDSDTPALIAGLFGVDEQEVYAKMATGESNRARLVQKAEMAAILREVGPLTNLHVEYNWVPTGDYPGWVYEAAMSFPFPKGSIDEKRFNLAHVQKGVVKSLPAIFQSEKQDVDPEETELNLRALGHPTVFVHSNGGEEVVTIFWQGSSPEPIQFRTFLRTRKPLDNQYEKIRRQLTMYLVHASVMKNNPDAMWSVLHNHFDRHPDQKREDQAIETEKIGYAAFYNNDRPDSIWKKGTFKHVRWVYSNAGQFVAQFTRGSGTWAAISEKKMSSVLTTEPDGKYSATTKVFDMNKPELHPLFDMLQPIPKGVVSKLEGIIMDHHTKEPETKAFRLEMSFSIPWDSNKEQTSEFVRYLHKLDDNFKEVTDKMIRLLVKKFGTRNHNFQHLYWGVPTRKNPNNGNKSIEPFDYH